MSILVCSTNAAGQFVNKEDFYLIDHSIVDGLTDRNKYVLDSCIGVFSHSQSPVARDEAISSIYDLFSDFDRIPYLELRFQHLQTQIELTPKDSSWEGLMHNLVYCSNRLGWNSEIQNNLDTAVYYYLYAFKIAELSNFDFGKQRSLIALTSVHLKLFDYSKAMDFALQSLILSKNMEDTWNKAEAYRNIATVYEKIHEVDKSLEYYLKAIEIHKRNEELQEIPYIQYGIALLYYNTKDYDKSLNYLHDCSNIFEIHETELALAKSYELTAKCYFEKEFLDSSLIYLQSSVEIFESASYWLKIADCYNLMGRIFLVENNKDSGIFYIDKALEIANAHNLINIQSTAEYILANYYLENNSIEGATILANSSLKLAIEINEPDLIQKSAFLMHELYEINGNYKKSLDMYKLSMEKNQIVHNSKFEKQMIISHHKYKIDLQKQKNEALTEYNNVIEENQSFLQKENQLISEKKQAQSLLIVIILFALLLLLTLVYYLVYKLKLIRKQKVLINLQKTEIEKQFKDVDSKNKETKASIIYSNKILSTIIPELSDIKKYFNDCFLILSPMDIIGGDFFWIKEEGNKLLFATADCTGHGVPGALLSIFCTRTLNRVIDDKPWVTDPGMILDHTSNLVVNDFSHDNSLRDGMDIALCTITNKTLSYAGARRPLWIIRRKTQSKPHSVEGMIEVAELDSYYWIKLCPCKQSIGELEYSTDFVTKTIELVKGDRLYMFSDGVTDQFGGIKNKKFQARRLIKLLVSIQSLPLIEQKKRIERAFSDWKDGRSQIDDECLMGIEF